MDKIDEQYFDDSQDKNNYMTKFQIDFRVYIYIYTHMVKKAARFCGPANLHHSVC